ncbi:glutathione S-transferase family protein [Thalassospira sp.]|uniref:glutathione S-transferase family protein n=1 Tax=Thalassospira sp. TaxID=1912094 RepID=UPI000C626702|nr:glutathione S-transferase family protein [Thalassospira sp.]MBC06579.1 glutathione S-transferase [Thalassospira sp.]|tara:strand:- start:6794 stop:7462 length:669 start_codon:yes stop_codon:yes gene_type:complete
MSDVTIIGMPRSSLTRTVRIACLEKEIAFDFSSRNVQPPGHPPTHELLHNNPFGKVPVLTHGPFVLYETAAICRYIDDNFPGPLLRPVSAQKVARMNQWISLAMTRLDQDIIRNFVIPMVFAEDATRHDPGFAIHMNKMADHIRYDLQVLNTAYADGWLFGDRFTIPDMMIMPMIHYLGAMPGGAGMLADAPHIESAFARFKARSSAAQTDPLLPEKLLKTA